MTKLYGSLAEYYDMIYSWKDYENESAHVMKLINQYKRSGGNDLLEVACGTGKHLEHLRKHYSCTGIDLNQNILNIAKKRVSGVAFKKANMVDFSLKKKFDAITCLFSSIGYVKTVKNLEKTLRSFARQLKPGGVVVIEPWLPPGKYDPGRLHMNVVDRDDVKVVRMTSGAKRGNVSIMTFHFLIGVRGKVEYIEDKHELGMFTKHEFLSAMKKAGFEAKFLSAGLMDGRGLYVGVLSE